MIKRELYLDGAFIDLDNDTVVATSDNSQPITNLFALESSRTNSIKIPLTKNNRRVFGDLHLPASESPKRYLKMRAVYLQDDREVISNGIAYIIRSGNKGYTLSIYGGEADLYDALPENPDGSEKTLQSLDFSDLNFVNDRTKIDTFKTQYADRLTRKLFFPLVQYVKDTIVPPLQRNLTFVTWVEGVNSWLQTFLSKRDSKTNEGLGFGVFNSGAILPNRRDASMLFPAVKFHEVVQRIASEAGYDITIPAGLRTEQVVIPFCNDTVALKDSFVESRTVKLGLNSNYEYYGGPILLSIPFSEIIDPENVYYSNRYHAQPLAGVDKLITDFEVSFNFTYYYTALTLGVPSPAESKLQIGWQNTANPADIIWVKGYTLANTYSKGANFITVTDVYYKGTPTTIAETFTTSNFDYPDRALVVRVYLHGTLIVSAQKTNFTLRPAKNTKYQYGAVWGVGENLPPLKQSDVLKAFLALNGLSINKDTSEGVITLYSLEERLSQTGFAEAIDLTEKLDSKQGYNDKSLGNTFAKNNTLEYKKDNTVTETNVFNITAGGLEKGKNAQKVFSLPFAPTDDLIPSLGGGDFDFSPVLTTGHLPLCDEGGRLVAKIEPRLLLLNFFEGYGSPNINDELFFEYEPPLFLQATYPPNNGTELPTDRPTGILVENIVTASFTQTNSSKYAYYDLTDLKIASIGANEYNRVAEIIPATGVYEAYFYLNADLYLKVSSKRVVKITSGELEGFWYVNKMENYIRPERATKLELQRI
jgi:hypothetical protein